MRFLRYAIIITLLIPAATALAQMGVEPSPFMNYQGVLRDDTGAPETGSFDMTFRFFDAETAGNEILVDAHLTSGTGAVTVAGGLFNVALGTGDVSDGSASLPNDPYSSLGQVFRDFATVYMEVQIASETLSPRIRVLASAYALNADHLDGKDASEYLDTSADAQVKAGDLTVDDLSATGNLSVGGVVSISGGTPAAGRILTSDAGGNATWEEPVPGPEGPPGPEGAEGPPGPPGVTGLPVHSATTVDPNNDAGVNGAVTIGADGRPVIAYVDATTGVLKVARCSDAACTSASTVNTGVDGRTHERATTGIAIGPDGYPVISHADIAVVHCEDADCSSVSERHLSGNGYTSIAVGPDGYPVLSFAGGDLFFVRCADIECEFQSEVRVDMGMFTFTSLAYAPDGLPVIAYAEDGRTRYNYARCGDPNCTMAGTTDLFMDPMSTEAGRQVSLTIGHDGLPIAAFYNAEARDLVVRHCDNLNCSSGTLTTLDNTGDVGTYASITVPPDGLPIISYYDETNRDLRVAKCSNAACTSATIRVVDSAGDVGRYSSIAIGTDGMPIISYYDATGGDMKVVHCTNRYCIPHYTRR